MPSQNTTMNIAPPSMLKKNAGLLKRLAAMVYDFFLLFAISMAYSAIVLTIKVQLLGLTLAPGQKAQMGLVGFIGWALLLMLFYCFFWRRFGQTLGMKAWRLELENISGEPPTVLQCIIRCITATLSFGLLGIGYWWLWLSADNKTLHDILSKTQVIQRLKEKKP